MQPHEVVATLRAAGCVYAEEEAGLLLAAAPGPDELAALVAARARGLPLEHLLGWAAFRGLRVHVDPGVFVPRRRTELLVARAVALAPPRPVVVDLCCGSGAVGAALLAELEVAELHAADVDPRAVACARRNLGRARVHEGDLFDALPDRLRGGVQLLVVNAPYVPTDGLALMPAEARLHEPRTALDGGPDGLDLHRRVAAGAPGWLAPGGRLLLETSEAQATATTAALRSAGLEVQTDRCEELGAVVVVGRRC